MTDRSDLDRALAIAAKLARHHLIKITADAFRVAGKKTEAIGEPDGGPTPIESSSSSDRCDRDIPADEPPRSTVRAILRNNRRTQP